MNTTIKYLLLLTVLAFTTTGCFLQSVHPLVTSESAISVDGLEGVWESGDQRWIFMKDPREIDPLYFNGTKFDGEISIEPDSSSTLFDDPNAYLIKVESLQDLVDSADLFIGYVGEFNGDLFLDLSLFDVNLGDENFRDSHLFPVHTFSKIAVLNDELSIEFFKDSWIRNLILDNRVRIAHEKTGGPLDDPDENILITASTDELQEFVLKYGKDEKAFDDPIVLKANNNEL